MPVPDAMILLNGTYICNGQVYTSNFSGATDSHGYAAFSVVPYAKYSVTVIPPASIDNDTGELRLLLTRSPNEGVLRFSI